MMLTGALVVALFASRADGISVGRVDVHATPIPVKICFDLPSTHTGVSESVLVQGDMHLNV